MKIPQPDETIDIEYKGDRIPAVVNSVFPHPTERGIFRLWLHVNVPIRVGEYVRLVTEEGRFGAVGY